MAELFMAYIEHAEQLGWAPQRMSGHIQKWYLDVPTERVDMRLPTEGVFMSLPLLQAIDLVEELERRVEMRAVMANMFADKSLLCRLINQYTARQGSDVEHAWANLSSPARVSQLYLFYQEHLLQAPNPTAALLRLMP